MSKLQRAVDGQTIQFLPLPKIFNTLSADLPSGAVKLPNGEVAYWRLHRNLAELKKQRKNVKELTAKLAAALAALVNSDSFKNHYGLTEAPSLPSDSQLATLFRNLLQLNTNRVDYSSVSYGRGKPLVETIQVPLGNLVFFNAIRGVASAPKVSGIKGKLWLKEGSDADQAYSFTIVSPVVELADFIGPDRLQAEILNKIKQNLPALAFNPKIVFDEDQFKNYVGASLQALGEKFGGQQNGNKKQKNTPKQNGLSGQHASDVETPAVQAAFNNAVEQPSLTDAGGPLESLVDPEFDGRRPEDFDVDSTNTAVSGQQVDPEAGIGQFVDRTQTSVQLDENDPNPQETIEAVMMNASQAAMRSADARDAQRKAELGTVVLCAEVFNELTTADKGVYLAAVERKLADRTQWSFVRKVMESGILHDEYTHLNDTFSDAEKISQPVYIGRVIFQMTRDQISEVLGSSAAFNAEVAEADRA